eukprot:4574579-Prymnesium_polylepis.1
MSRSIEGQLHNLASGLDGRTRNPEICHGVHAAQGINTIERPPAHSKAHHDRLTSAAISFVEKYARSFGGGGVQDEWQLVQGGGHGRYVFSASGEGDGRTRPFTTVLGWSDCFYAGCSLRMPTVPGLASPFNFSLPDGDIDGKSFKITIPNIDAQAVRKDSFVVSQLFIKKPPQPEGDASHDAVDPPAVDPPAVAAHEPVTSQFGPPVPVSELYARLCVE